MAFTRFTKLLIELTRTSFFWTSNKLKCVLLLVIKLEHPIFGFEQRTSNIVRPITKWWLVTKISVNRAWTWLHSLPFAWNAKFVNDNFRYFSWFWEKKLANYCVISCEIDNVKGIRHEWYFTIYNWREMFNFQLEKEKLQKKLGRMFLTLSPEIDYSDPNINSPF